MSEKSENSSVDEVEPPAAGEAPLIGKGQDNSVVVRESRPRGEVPAEQPTVTDKVKTLLVGKGFDLADRRVYHYIALAAFLAWVGLGADGLSSSCYGPAEAFKHLQEHSYLAIFLA